MLTAPWTGPVQRRGMLPYDTIQESLCFPDPDLDARHREYAAGRWKKTRRTGSTARPVARAARGGGR